jgi:hypothetical protein
MKVLLIPRKVSRRESNEFVSSTVSSLYFFKKKSMGKQAVRPLDSSCHFSYLNVAILGLSPFADPNVAPLLDAAQCARNARQLLSIPTGHLTSILHHLW